MLVLTRRLNRTITIGDPKSPGTVIEVSIIQVRGEQVHIGINAPLTTAIHWAEVYELIQREQAKSKD